MKLVLMVVAEHKENVMESQTIALDMVAVAHTANEVVIHSAENMAVSRVVRMVVSRPDP
jgi:hypothetical protein